MHPSRPYLANLTALRGIAALLVVAYQSHALVGPLHAPGATHLTTSFFLMPDLFFIISGFVICHVYAESFAAGVTRAGIREFVAVRFARAYPLHLVTMAVVAACSLALFIAGKWYFQSPAFQYMTDPVAFLGNVFMLQSVGVFGFLTANGPAWGIGALWWVWMAFPFAAPFFGKIGVRGALLLAAACAAGWWLLEHDLSYLEKCAIPTLPPKGGMMNVEWRLGWLRAMIGFAAGLAIWKLWSLGFLKNWLTGGWQLLFLTLFWLAAGHFDWPDTAICCTFAAIVLVAANGTGVVDSVLQTPVLQRLGDWSYSVLMWHFALFALWNGWLVMRVDAPMGGMPFLLSGGRAWLGCAVWVGATVVVAGFSYRFIERPARRWVRAALSS